MDTGNIFTLVGVVTAILAHAFATVWWASKVSATLQSILVALVKIDSEFEKRDRQISKLWEKVDLHSETLASHGAMLKHNEK